MCLNIQNKHREIWENDFKLACKRGRDPSRASAENLFSAYRGFVSSPEKIELWIRITQPVTIGGVLRVIPISNDEKADCEWDKDTLKKGIKRRVFIISIDPGITKNLKSPQGIGKNGRKTQNFGRFSELFRQIWPPGGF